MPENELVEMQQVTVNDRWTIYMPSYRAERPEWTTTGWEVERLDSMCKNIGPGDIVYDVGTEEGEITGLIQSWIGNGDGGVCMFEPNCAVWPNAKAIWEANRFPDPIYAFHGYAGSATTIDLRSVMMKFQWPECVNEPMIRAHGFKELHEAGSDIIRLDDFAAIIASPSVITIDVEGGELHVLKGAEMMLYDDKPLIYISVHPDEMVKYGHSEAALHAYLYELGYRVKHLADDHERHYAAWHPHGRELRL